MGEHILGKITRRILGGDIPSDAVSNRRIPVDNRPKPDSVRNAKGQGLGKGATRKRSGKGAQTEDN